MFTKFVTSQFAETRLPFALVVLAAVLSTLDSVGMVLAHHGPHIATLWPAKGVLLAVALYAPRRNTWAILTTAVAASLGTKLLLGGPLLASLSGTLLSIGGTGLAVWMCRWAIGDAIDFRDWRTLLRFLAISCAVAAAVGIPGAALLAVAKGADVVDSWLSWSLATSLSYLMIVPPLVLIAGLQQVRSFHQKRRIAVATLLMAAVTFAVFRQSAAPLTYVIPICLLTVAVVAEIEATALALLVTALVAVTLTVAGHGPAMFIHDTIQIQVISVQIFLVALTFGILPAAAAISERNRLRLGLQTALVREEKAAAELGASEQRYRLLAEQSKDIIVRTDHNGIMRYVSPGCRAFGYEPEELVGLHGSTLVHPEDLATFTTNTLSLFDGETPSPQALREHRFRTKSGEWVWLQGNPSVVHGDDGAPLEIVNVFRDVTERRAMDQALAEAVRAAEAAAHAKSEFLANMSHELRTPLTSIIGFSDLLRTQPELSASSQRFAERVVQASEALLAIVNDVLDFSKLEAGQFEIRPEPASIRRVVADAVQLFLPQAQQKGIALTSELSPEIPDNVLIDSGRVRQVLLNLVGNAVKFTDAGSIVVRASYGEGWLACEVADSGAGIPEDKQARLFERFSQIDGSSRRTHSGTGLGLAICKGLIEAMGGTIGVASEEGRGSLFRFEIPCPAVDAPRAPQRDGGMAVIAGLRLLAADDNRSNRVLLEAILTPFAVDLTLVANGREAVDIAGRTRFDVILMDVHMPEMNGPDAARAIREQGPNTATPILAFTADALRDVDPDARLFDGVVLKPLSVSVLSRAIRDAADARQAAA